MGGDLLVGRLLQELGRDLACLQQVFGELRRQGLEPCRAIGFALTAFLDFQSGQIDHGDDEDACNPEQQDLAAKAEMQPSQHPTSEMTGIPDELPAQWVHPGVNKDYFRSPEITRLSLTLS